ncbi:hypothetical protein SAMD00023353_0501450 [Rosellinia necatrix]|uniref:Uncharacterized protein n=1 Tax=Rosellinia necatrix TaxID=77044 RepID=A0A1S7UKE8_ROSNE|nr:hypothetical protein SAMD00023353_0501450 [Rosellinia necatrix]
MTTPQRSGRADSGQFNFLGKIGATPEAVATLNDQPHVFYVLVGALVVLILQGLFIWYIHFATMKPEQKKKKEKKADEKKPGAKPPAQR